MAVEGVSPSHRTINKAKIMNNIAVIEIKSCLECPHYMENQGMGNYAGVCLKTGRHSFSHQVPDECPFLKKSTDNTKDKK